MRGDYEFDDDLDDLDDYDSDYHDVDYAYVPTEWRHLLRRHSVLQRNLR